jgi:hypothetical protein
MAIACLRDDRSVERKDCCKEVVIKGGRGR